MRVRDDLAQVVERVIQVVHPTPLTGVDAQPGANTIKSFLTALAASVNNDN